MLPLPALPSSTLQQTTFLAYRSRFTSHPLWAIEMILSHRSRVNPSPSRNVPPLCLT
jgi:hypothetical protein